MDTVIFEFDRPILRSLFYFSEPGICAAPVVIPTGFVVGLGDFAGTYDYRTTRIELKSASCLLTGTWRELKLTTNKANLRAQNESFYFEGNIENQTIHLHLDDFRPWWTVDRIKLGYTMGFSNNGYHNGVIYYPPALVTEGLTVKRGVQNILEVSSWYVENSIEIRNDGSLGDIATWGLFNRPARMYVGNKTAAFTAFTQILASRVAAVPTVGPGSVTLRLQDRKKYWTDKVSAKTYTQTDYPSLPDKYLDKRIRVAFGTVIGIKCVPISEYTFKICDVLDYDGISEVTTVYKDGVEVTPSATDLAAATVTLDSGDVDGFDDDITADVKGVVDSVGAVIKNDMTIARELIRYVKGLEYISDNYDTDAWDEYETTAPDGALVIEDEELKDVLDKLSLSARVTIFQTREGKISAVRADEAKGINEGIVRQHNVQNEPEAEYDDEGMVSAIEVTYDRDYSTDEGLVYLDDSQEETIYREYERKATAPYEVAIKSRTAAAEWAAAVLAFFDSVPTYFRASVPMDDYLSWLFFDTLFIEINRYGATWYGTVKALIESLEFRLDDMMVDWRLRYIGELTGGYEPITDEAGEFLTDEAGLQLYTEPEVA